MADAYFRVAHHPVATLTSCGPGSTNLLTALASAMMDSSAMLAITGNVPTSQFNRAPFQETGRHFQAEFPNVMRPYVKKAFQPTRVEMLPVTLRQAFKTMLTGRPGPVGIDVPLNCFAEEAEVEVPEPGLWRKGIRTGGSGTTESAEQALEMLLAAEKPCILAGNGAMISEAGKEIQKLSKLLGIPVATTANGKGIIPEDNPLSLGVIGRNGTYMANESCRSCEVLLAVGAKFDDRQSISWIPGYSFNIPPTQLIHVDIDPEELGRNYPPTLGIQADAKSFMGELCRVADLKIEKTSDSTDSWLNEIRNWREDWTEFNRAFRVRCNPDPPRKAAEGNAEGSSQRSNRCLRCGRASQLGDPVLRKLRTSDNAPVLGICFDGFRRLRSFGSQTGRAGKSLCFGLR